MSLSDKQFRFMKRVEAEQGKRFLRTFAYEEDDVRKFIKELKEELSPFHNFDFISIIIDKLAGEKLIINQKEVEAK